MTTLQFDARLLLILTAGVLALPASRLQAQSEFTTLTTNFQQGYLCVAFSPEGKFLAAAGEWNRKPLTGHVTIWEIATGEMVFRNGGFPSTCGPVAFAPDGQTLAVSCADRSTYVFASKLVKRRQTWVPLEQLRQSGRWGGVMRMPADIQFSPDGDRLAVVSHRPYRQPAGGEFQEIQVWNTSRLTNLPHELRPPGLFRVGSLRFLDDERLVISNAPRIPQADRQSELHVIDIASDQITQSCLLDEKLTSTSWNGLDVSPDRKLIAVGTTEHIALLNAQPLETVRKLPSTKPVDDVRFAPNGKILASCESVKDGEIRLWDVETGTELTSRKHLYVNTVVFSPDGATLASITNTTPEDIRLWDMKQLLPGTSLAPDAAD